jgi:hypothetical protein
MNDHTCSYYCQRPECIRAQRDELHKRLASLDVMERLTEENERLDLYPRWFMESNDGERTEAFVLSFASTPSDDYIFFYTLDQLGRPTPRIAHAHSKIVQGEMGGLLVRVP